MKTVFKVGKTYRMIGGGSATIKRQEGNRLIGASSEPYVRCWKLNGQFSCCLTTFDLIHARSEPCELINGEIA
jgi:hypothetical protein